MSNDRLTTTRTLIVLLIAAAAATTACNGDYGGLSEVVDADSVYTMWQFVDVTERAGLSDFQHETGATGDHWLPETMGAGVGVLDYDTDGLPDVALVRGGHWENNALPALALYRNTGDGSFVDATESARLGSSSAVGMGLAIGDYDNDGDPDVFLTSVGRNQLHRNDGGVFTEVGTEAGLADEVHWSTAALFFDADRDGWLDLFVGNYVKWSPETDIYCSTDGESKSYCTPETYEGEKARFYHNNGDGSFADWTEGAGFGVSIGKTLGVVTLDVNRDQWPDLVVANDTQRDELYINNADGTFSERGIVSGLAFDDAGRTRAGMGIDAGVVDKTEELSVFVGNFSKEMIAVYRHEGAGIFTDRAAISKIGWPSLQTLTFGLRLFDADLDGDLDLLAINGHIIKQVDLTRDGTTYRQPPHLFLNDGDGLFEDVAPEMPAMRQEFVGRGGATIDFDRDGDLDVILTENGGGVYLFKNTAVETGARFLRITLEGRTSNRDGFGSELIAITDGVRQYRTLRSGSSYLSQSEATALFGLGNATQVDELVVRWPSGAYDTLRTIKDNSELHLVEGDDASFTK